MLESSIKKCLTWSNCTIIATATNPILFKLQKNEEKIYKNPDMKYLQVNANIKPNKNADVPFRQISPAPPPRL